MGNNARIGFRLAQLRQPLCRSLTRSQARGLRQSISSRASAAPSAGRLAGSGESVFAQHLLEPQPSPDRAGRSGAAGRSGRRRWAISVSIADHALGMSSSAKGRSPCSSSHSTTRQRSTDRCGRRARRACARGPGCTLRAARATYRPGCRRNRPPALAPSSCEQKLMLKSASLGEPSAASSTLAGFTSRCSTPCWCAWSSACASCTPSRQTVSGQLAAASRRIQAANRLPTTAPAFPIAALHRGRCSSAPLRAAGGVSRTCLTTSASVPPGAYCMYSSRTRWSGSRRWSKTRMMFGWSSVGQRLRLVALVGRDLERDQPLHRHLPGEKDAAEGSFAQLDEQVEVVDAAGRRRSPSMRRRGDRAASWRRGPCRAHQAAERRRPSGEIARSSRGAKRPAPRCGGCDTPRRSGRTAARRFRAAPETRPCSVRAACRGRAWSAAPDRP